MRALALALLLAGCAGAAGGTVAGPAGPPEGPWRQQTHWIPVTEAGGGTRLLLGRVCRPAGDAPAPVVVIAHGSPPLASARPAMRLTACGSEAARWFLERGRMVVFALRRGYGGTGGPYAESSAGCSVEAYLRAAREGARDVQAIVDYAAGLPGARPDGVMVVGQSAGGWAAVGLDSGPHPRVTALVSMAGGRGGHVGNRPNANCHPENLVAAAGELGRAAGTPMLWVYTANDSYFDPALAASMHRAFTEAGGRADLRQLGPFDGDGHRLFFGAGGSLTWGPLIEPWLPG